MNQLLFKGASSFILFLLLHLSLQAQIIVSGLCISGPVTLNSVAAVEGRPAFEGTGTVAGNANVSIAIFWIGAPDNLWVLAFNGQPYFSNACDVAEPPGTDRASCPWTAVTGFVCAGGTGLSVTGPGVLPVRLLSFRAQKGAKVVELEWRTGNELNNKGFSVERSADGINWISLGFVPGAGTSSVEKTYHFTDHSPLNGKNYYRLAQTDLNGAVSYSLVVPVDFTVTAFYTLTNNPGKGLYQLTIHSPGPIELTLADEKGRVVLQKKVVPGVQQLDLRGYAAGVYLLQLVKDNTTVTEKLIKL